MRKALSAMVMLLAAAAALGAADISVAALRGPTAIGMVRLMDESRDGNAADGNSYTFRIEGAADAIVPLLVRSDADIAAIPANLASVLYNRTDGGIRVIAINTLGVLYIVENGESVHSLEDLRGRTIYSAGKGATPEYALQHVLRSGGLEPGRDVMIEWKSEHSECVAALKSDPEGVAMLPQPFASTAMMQQKGIRIALDLNELWVDAAGSVLITGVTVATEGFIESEPEALEAFLSSYRDSVDYVYSDLGGAAALTGEFGIVPEAAALRAIPYCRVVLITGSAMEEALSAYLSILYSQNPASVGGKLPDEAFYYTGE